jgi:hypothetical protein
MIKRIHVNRHNVAYNKKHGTHRPVFTVKTYKSNTKMNYVNCPDGVKLVYRPDKPLACGAVAWMETEGRVYNSLGLEIV